MAIKIEDHLPVVKYNGLNTDKAVALGSTLSVTGSVTMDSTLAVTGAVTSTGAVSGPRFFQTDASAATITVTAAQSGGTFLATKGSATQTYTLPAVAAGLRYTFICGHASGEILIDQAASEVITITSFAAVGVDADTGIIATAAGTGIKNTAATNAIGDSITLISDGTGWYSIGIGSGIWASQ
jgi:hypothetical protein